MSLPSGWRKLTDFPGTTVIKWRNLAFRRRYRLPP